MGKNAGGKAGKAVATGQVIALDSVQEETPAQKMGLDLICTDRKKPDATIENIERLLNHYGVVCRYNVITKEVELTIPGTEFSTDNSHNAGLGWIASKMHEVKMATAHYQEFLLCIAERNIYNPVLEWIESRPWDGISRLQELYATITPLYEEDEAAKCQFMYRWMVGAVASACSDGIDGQGVLVLQGNQNLGKTWWIRKLVPPELDLIRTDASIDTRNKDSIEQLVAYWIVELGELDATFRKSDIASLKAIITANRDIFRKSYAARASGYPRRTVFAASVNEWNYLHDTTGNRRFWSIACKQINSYHTIDMQQLWAEIYHEWKHCGADYRMTEEERVMLARINSRHAQIDPIKEMILDHYAWSMEWYPDWKSATQIAREIGLKNITQKETRAVSAFVRELNGNKTKLTDGYTMFHMPVVRGK